MAVKEWSRVLITMRVRLPVHVLAEAPRLQTALHVNMLGGGWRTVPDKQEPYNYDLTLRLNCLMSYILAQCIL